MPAGVPRPGRRLKAPGEGNRGQQGLGYEDFTWRAGAAVSEASPLLVAGWRNQQEAGSKTSSGKLPESAAALSSMPADKVSWARRVVCHE